MYIEFLHLRLYNIMKDIHPRSRIHIQNRKKKENRIDYRLYTSPVDNE